MGITLKSGDPNNPEHVAMAKLVERLACDATNMLATKTTHLDPATRFNVLANVMGMMCRSQIEVLQENDLPDFASAVRSTISQQINATKKSWN